MKAIAAISLVYDVSVGIAMSVYREDFNALFGLPGAVPPIHADLNAIFVTFVGVGYALPFHDPRRYRAYMWIFGVALKTAGAIAFGADYVLRGSPAAFVLFAASDALIAGLTVVALLRTEN